MSQDQAIEAARTRIQRLVEEISALSKRDLSTEQFLPEFISRVVKASDARGGAVWLVGQRSADGKAEFQLGAAVDFPSSLFQSDEVQRALLLKALAECVNQRKPLVLQPMQQQPQPGSQQAQLAQLRGEAQAAGPQNKTAYPFLHVPLPLKDSVLGVLQVWLQPYVTVDNYKEFATFLTQLAAYVEAHFQSRRLGSLVLETQRLQHLLKFTHDVAGTLDPLEVARLAVNYGRDLIGCERCSVLWRDGDKWRVLAISGQEVVEKKSTMVKAMNAFVPAHVKEEIVVLSKKELLAAHSAEDAPLAEGKEAELVKPRTRTDEIDLAYFEVSQVTSAAIAPFLDADKNLIGAYFAESTSEGFFEGMAGSKEQPLAIRVTEWLATHSGKSLLAAEDYRSLPFVGTSRRLRATHLAFTGPKRKRNMLRLAIWGGALAAILLFPWMDRVEGDCTLSPANHSLLVAEVPGRIEKVLVREGSRVAKDGIVAELDKSRIETELETARKEILRLEAEAESHRGAGDEARAQIASLQAAAGREAAKNREADLAAATLRSQIDGVVLTKDIEKRAGEFIQAGTVFAEVAALDAWDLKLDVNQREIGRVEQRLEKGPIDISYILYSQTAHTLGARLESHRQISAAAESRQDEHVFIIKVENVQIPEQVQASLRPGLSGRARIDLGRKPLGWLWLRGIWDWGRLLLIK